MNGDSKVTVSATTKADRQDSEIPPHNFLREYLGEWIEGTDAISIVASPLRDQKGWDGSIRPVVGVIDQNGAGVLSLSPYLAEKVTIRIGRSTILKDEMPLVASILGAREFFGVFRWSTQIATFEDIGEWIDADHPIVPEWLKPFGHRVLMAFDEDRSYIGGVGIKHHLEYGREIAVVVEERAAGRQIARRLVSKAAQEILDDSKVPIYLHAEANVASAKVAEAVGFKDVGWKIIGMVFDGA
jgi:GNAT superfamily N-acetyltransferase